MAYHSKSIKPTIILMFIFQVGILNANFDQIMMLTKQMGNSMLKNTQTCSMPSFIVWVSARVVSPSQQQAGLFKSIVNFALLLLVPTT